MKRILLIAAAGLAALCAIVAVRTAMASGGQTYAFAPPAPDGALDQVVAQHLSEAIRIKTVSHSLKDPADPATLSTMHAFLAQTYPAFSAAAERETVNGGSLLYRWRGTDPDAAPVVFLAHMDVVPVEAGTENDWTRPPFSGDIEGGYVWGRGALDDKGTLITLMEAGERLASEGFRPSRDIYFAFGHDEELGGGEGAAKIAALLAARGVHAAWTLDEGSGVIRGMKGLGPVPVALISVAEKGYASLTLTAHARGGHSSTPPDETAVTIVAKAVATLSDHPYPVKLDGPTAALLARLAPQMPLAKRALVANLWLTRGLVAGALAKDPVLAATMRTTTAPTMIGGGAKDNVIPQEADAVVNFRIHPRDTAEGVMARARKLIDDPRIDISYYEPPNEPSPLASTSGEGYAALSKSISATFGNIPVAPFMTVGGTDSKHYAAVTGDAYRFTPFIVEPADLTRIHGTDERIAVEDLGRMTAFYETLIRNAAGG